jgi:hypothetical protein
MQTYYDNIFLKVARDNMVVAQFADTKTVPLYRGKTVDFFRRKPIAHTTTAITEGSETMNQTDFSGENITATVAHYAQWSKYSRFVSLTSRDPELRTLAEEFGITAAHAVDDILMTEIIMRGAIPVRVDELLTTSTWTRTGVVDSNTSLNSSVALVDASIDESTDAYWSGAHIGFFDEFYNNYGYGGQVTAFDESSDYITMSPGASTVHDSGGGYRMVSGSGLASTDVLTGTAMKYTAALANALRFYKWDGGWLHTILCPETHSDLQDDTVYLAVAEYHDSDKTIYNGIIKKLWGHKFFMGNTPYRETTVGVYSATGDVFCTPTLGRYAFAKVDLAGHGEPKIIVKTPGPQTTSQPYNENKTIAYDLFFTGKALNAAFAINTMSGATPVLR